MSENEGGTMTHTVRAMLVALLTFVALTVLAVFTHAVAALASYGAALLLQSHTTSEGMLAVTIVGYLTGVVATAVALSQLVERLRPHGLVRALLGGAALFSVPTTIGLVLVLVLPTAVETMESAAYLYFVQPFALLIGLVALVLWLVEARTYGARGRADHAEAAPGQEDSVSLTTSSSEPERYPSRSCVT